ncbi:MAG: choline monooxygenase [Parasphingorhabdus sp.]|jgi:choline monooxygenase
MSNQTAAMATLVSPDNLQAIFSPIEDASGMPNAAYTSQENFEFERDNLFAKTWVAIDFVGTLKVSSVRPIDFMGYPLLITSTKQGELTVFHNVCSHRGTKLVEEERQTKGIITCPYHSWSYAHNGELKATPHIGGVGVHKIDGFNCAKHKLREIRSHIWMGILFVNLDGNAPAFEQSAEHMIRRVNHMMGKSGESLIRIPAKHGMVSMDVNCNWKLAIENYLEAYHLPFVHPGLNSYSPLEKHLCEIYGDNSAGQLSTTFDPVMDSENPLPIFPDWNPDMMTYGDWPTLYPNLLLGFQPNHVFAMIVRPVSKNQSREDLALFYVGDSADDPKLEAAHKKNLDDWCIVFNEDIGPCERMQIGRNSPGFQGGAFSPTLDKCSHHFHKWVGRHYQANQ